MTRKVLLFAGIPLAGVLVCGLALVFRSGQGAAEKAPEAGPTAAKRFEPTIVPASTAPRPALAAPTTVAAESYGVQVRSTYQNYRTAIATRNAALEKALLPVLVKDRTLALQYAREDLARAKDSLDRDITLRTIEALGR